MTRNRVVILECSGDEPLSVALAAMLRRDAEKEDVAVAANRREPDQVVFNEEEVIPRPAVGVERVRDGKTEFDRDTLPGRHVACSVQERLPVGDDVAGAVPVAVTSVTLPSSVSPKGSFSGLNTSVNELLELSTALSEPT